jgi:hypothetical protein
MVVAKRMAPFTMKGISREIVPYGVEAIVSENVTTPNVMREQLAGVSLFLDPTMIEASEVERIKTMLAAAIAKLEDRVRASATPAS